MRLNNHKSRALRSLLGVLAFGGIVSAAGNAFAVLTVFNNPTGAASTAYVGHDPSDGHEWIAWKPKAGGSCTWQDLGAGGFATDVLANAGPNGDQIIIVTSGASWSWCGFTLQGPNYNGNHFDVNGGNGNDYLQSDMGNTYMYGNKGDDVVRNNGGLGRILQGNDGNDTILTGYLTNGNIQGNNGDDCMVVYQSTNTPVSCGAGTDKWNGAGTRPADCESTYLYCCPGVIC